MQNHHSATVIRYLDFKHLQLREIVRCTFDIYFQTAYYFFCEATEQLGSKLHHFEVSRLPTQSVTQTLGRIHKNNRSISTPQRPLCTYNTQPTQATNIHAISGIPTRDPSNQAATDLRHTRHSHRDWNAVYLSQ